MAVECRSSAWATVSCTVHIFDINPGELSWAHVRLAYDPWVTVPPGEAYAIVAIGVAAPKSLHDQVKVVVLLQTDRASRQDDGVQQRGRSRRVSASNQS